MNDAKIDNIKEQLIETVKKMASFMDLNCQVEVKEELDPALENLKGGVDEKNNKTLLVSVYTPDNARFLIGKDGQNLKALEHLLRTIFLKRSGDIGNIVVDVNDYRRSRAIYVVDLARQVVARVRSTQKAEALLPMSGYERRIIHMELASYPDIATESIGAEPQRRIVVKPYP